MSGADGVLVLAAGSGGPIPIAVALVIVLGVCTQLVAAKVRVPSILLLLIAGVAAGPVLRHFSPNSILALDPDGVLGKDLLLSLVGISVGLILYEGGLTLRLDEIKGTRRVIAMLVSAGAVVTWLIAALGSYLILGLPLSIAVLLGAVLIVTGPTVIGPLLAHIRPAGATASILRWEGIVIDPIGVLMAVLVFEVLLVAPESAAGVVFWAIAKTVIVGGGLGFFGAWLLKLCIKRYWVPDLLQNPFSLMLVVLTYVAANAFQAEAGLLATTVMGILLANQKTVSVHHILEFKENIRVLLIGALFIVLAARMQLEDLMGINWGALVGFVVLLVVVARPAAVFLSTIGAGLSINERFFLSCMAPRGIVAAAGASIFTLGLERAGMEEASRLAPLTFGIIVATVAIYGLGAPVAANLLGLADRDRRGVLFVGAPSWARALASALRARGLRVMLVDTNRENVRDARMAGLDARRGNALDDWFVDELDLRGIGRVFACTPNDEVNQLALQRLRDRFEKSELYRLAIRTTRASAKPAAQTHAGEDTEDQVTRVGRVLFQKEAHFQSLESRVANGWVVKATQLSAEFDYDDYQTLYGGEALPMFLLSNGDATVASTDRKSQIGVGTTVLGLVNPEALLMPWQRPAPSQDDHPPAS
ncbi:MAG: sodium:proton antiporter [Planctomycetota bacterium]